MSEVAVNIVGACCDVDSGGFCVGSCVWLCLMNASVVDLFLNQGIWKSHVKRVQHG